MRMSSSTKALLKAVIGNRERWGDRLRAGKASWDYCVITAANERQAGAYRLQMEWRERNGLWPRNTRWIVVPDPGGKRIGSGLATLHSLRQLRHKLKMAGSAHWLEGKRILVLHCGGSSIRTPHCSAFGKVFTALPVESAPGRCSTIFDENLGLLEGLGTAAPEGVFVAAGDVLVVFDPAATHLHTDKVTALTVAVPAERGHGHGVFLADRPDGEVRRIFQKYPVERLREEGAVDSGGNVLIDTGIFYLPASLVSGLLAEVDREASPLRIALRTGVEVDFYTDFSEALARQTPYEDYLAAARRGSRGQITRLDARRRLWELLHDSFRMCIAHRSPGTFFHLGSTADICRALQADSEVGKTYGFTRRVASDAIPAATHATLISCRLAGPPAKGTIGAGAILERCVLDGKYRIGRGALAVGLGWPGVAVRLKEGTAAFSVPLLFPNRFRTSSLSGKTAWVTAVYGVDDNPKQPITSPQATLMGRPASQWLAERDIAPRSVWPDDLPPEGRCLWNAQLFPVEVGERSTRWLEWLQMPAQQARAMSAPWQAEPRLSLEEIFAMTDCKKMVSQSQADDPKGQSMDEICNRISEILRDGRDSDIDRFYGNFRDVSQFLRVKSTLDQLALNIPCSLRRARIFKVASDMMADERFARVQQGNASSAKGSGRRLPVNEQAMLELWGHAYEELAFANVRLAIEACVPAPQHDAARRLTPGVGLRVEVPARIDLGGGWSDTPPYSLERGGAVVNLALTLDGQCPVVAWAKTVSQPVIRLGSLDLGVTQEIANLEDMRTYDDVEDPLALHKATVVFESIVPKGAAGPVKAHMQRLGAGLELITECRLPKGSGMGTSSILAAAAVAALSALRGQPLDVKQLFNHVLCVEQMMTTGGGWQDQVGGAVGGIKYVYTTAKAPFNPRIEHIKLAPALLQEINERLVVYYTGRNRLAKNILRQIMGDYLSRRQPVFETLHKIRATADELRDAFHSRELDAVGRLMTQSWELNKKLNSTTSNERIDALFAVAEPYIVGGKLAGAGGGGFMALLAKDHASAERLRKILAGLALGTEQRLYSAAVDTTGIRVGHE